MRVLPTGRKVYVMRYRTAEGVQRLLTIGRVSDLSLDEARLQAAHTFGKVRTGNDPVRARQEARRSERLNDIFERYQKDTLLYRKPKTHEFNHQAWMHLCKTFGNIPAKSITASQVRDWMVDGMQNKPTKNNALSVLKKVLNWAEVKPNPCDKIKQFKIERVYRILSMEELQRIEKELTAFTPYFALLIRLLIVTGCRLREIMEARCEWVDLERRTLTLPTSKTGAKVVLLSSAACELLRGCHDREFIIMEPWAKEPLQYPYNSMNKLRQACGFHFRIHDLRHTHATRGLMAGLTVREVAHLLGHRQLSTTSKYLHYAPQEGRNPVEIAADAMRGK